MATVGALGDPELMEEIIASGKADVVLAARALMADPDLPKKARAGKADEIRPCIRCFECFAGITRQRQYRCAVNPEIGFEQDCRHALPATAQKTVLVAGGGVAGMQAALTAAERGHKVILCEKGDRLGGVLRCEEKVPFKRLLAELPRLPGEDDLPRAGRRAPGYSGDAESWRTAPAPTSSSPPWARARAIPQIPGIDGAERPRGGGGLLPSGEDVGKSHGAHSWAEAWWASSWPSISGGLGRQVTIMEMMETLSDGGNPVHGLALINEIKRYDIQVSTATRAVEITEKGVIGEYVGSAYTLPPCPDGAGGGAATRTASAGWSGPTPRRGAGSSIEADTVIYATGRQPASRRGGRPALLRAGVPSDRRLLDREKHPAGDAHGFRGGSGHLRAGHARAPRTRGPGLWEPSRRSRVAAPIVPPAALQRSSHRRPSPPQCAQRTWSPDWRREAPHVDPRVPEGLRQRCGRSRFVRALDAYRA